MVTAESESMKIERDERKRKERDRHFVNATRHFLTFNEKLKKEGLSAPLVRNAMKTLQINIGKLCNMTCHHCHVEAGPTKTRENMNDMTVNRVLDLLEISKQIEVVDLTGGAPEMNPHFRKVVDKARELNKEVIDRCNLTILYEPKMEWLADYLASNKVQVIASLPCYTLENVDKQRGNGTFDKSISALQWLNKLGYGRDPQLKLHLIYNPGGSFLPGPQKQLEIDYKRELKEKVNIVFNNLYTLTNMPIKRFADTLINLGQYEEYMNLLINAFNKNTVDKLMCRDQVSVSWDGKLYDCDFNQMLDLDIGAGKSRKKKTVTVWDIDNFDSLVDEEIATKKHCYGCTAGTGSSCGGSLV